MVNIGIAQLNLRVGDIAANTAAILHAYRNLCAAGAQLVITPELSLSGYPPEDLLFLPDFHCAIQQSIADLEDAVDEVPLVVGAPIRIQSDGPFPQCTNSALVLQNGTTILQYDKRALPNYGVFDEQRYFVAGTKAGTFPLRIGTETVKIAVTICEDIWDDAVVKSLPAADVCINISASPYEHGKQSTRIQVMRNAMQYTGATSGCYCNLVGGQDELVFDGQSFAIWQDDPSHGVKLPLATSATILTQVADRTELASAPGPEPDWQQVRQVLALGVHDYVKKSGFSRALVGLSGGIDSALVLAIAVDALGPENVLAISMPSRYNSPATREDAREQARLSGCAFLEIPIEDVFNASLAALQPRFKDQPWDLAEENLQSRIRGTLLMGVSNKENRLLLATGNRSEYAVGYATLYGDTNGAFAPLKDLYKTEVFALAQAGNRMQETDWVLPSIIERPPSAELRDGQRDDQSLPPYQALDAFLRAWLDDRLPAEQLTLPDAHRWIRIVQQAEYKRRQAPPGPKLGRYAFGRERRLPILNGFTPEPQP